MLVNVRKWKHVTKNETEADTGKAPNGFFYFCHCINFTKNPHKYLKHGIFISETDTA